MRQMKRTHLFGSTLASVSLATLSLLGSPGVALAGWVAGSQWYQLDGTPYGSYTVSGMAVGAVGDGTDPTSECNASLNRTYTWEGGGTPTQSNVDFDMTSAAERTSGSGNGQATAQTIALGEQTYAYYPTGPFYDGGGWGTQITAPSPTTLSGDAYSLASGGSSATLAASAGIGWSGPL